METEFLSESSVDIKKLEELSSLDIIAPQNTLMNVIRREKKDKLAENGHSGRVYEIIL